MNSLADTFQSNLTQFEQQLQDIKQQREEVLQQIYKLDPWQKREDFREKFKLQLKDFNKKLKKVDSEEERKKMIEEQLTLRDEQFYRDIFGLDKYGEELFDRRNWLITTSYLYKRLGQFDYGQPSCTTDHIKTCIDYNWIYIGEVKEGTDDTPHGIGIQVWNSGNRIEEGYWKDGKLHGRGRHIEYEGGYYIGEYKEGRENGEGTYYYKNGDKKYEGGWKDGNHYGQGTYYRKDGDKYTGQWDDWKGQGEINYKDGTKYIGQWDRLKRQGQGTLYSADGQVLNQGKWEDNEYKGKK